MARPRKFIIGGGISGLIFAFYNRDYALISPGLGGRLKDNYLVSIILLDNVLETRKLLTDLGVQQQPKNQAVGLFHEKQFHDGEISTTLWEEMVKKKLTPWSELANFNPSISAINTTLSAKKHYSVHEIPLDTIVKLLARNVAYIKDTVVNITRHEIVTKHATFEYDEIISTIPAPVFWKLYGCPKRFAYLPVTFVRTPSPPSQLCMVHQQQFVYFLDKSIPFTRVSTLDCSSFLYEFTGEITAEQVQRFIPQLHIDHISTDPYGIIITQENKPPKKVKFTGRFGVWDHTYKVQDVIKDALMHADAAPETLGKDWKIINDIINKEKQHAA